MEKLNESYSPGQELYRHKGQLYSIVDLRKVNGEIISFQIHEPKNFEIARMERGVNKQYTPVVLGRWESLEKALAAIKLGVTA